MPVQPLVQTLSERRRGRLPAAAAPTSARLGQVVAWLARFWWWSVRLHVATLHGLPRDEAVGPPPGFRALPS